jgi:cellulose synthase/poly-beta-1,6-N-acetylglucosamine synthase-like glycosyltransferase
VSVIIPTIGPEASFETSLLTIIKTRPLEVIVLTDEFTFTAIKNCVDRALVFNNLDFHNDQMTTVKVLTVKKASKRKQIVEGIHHARGKIIVFADDDVLWPRDVLQYMLACFEDPYVGGVGILQKVYVTPNVTQNIWHFLGALQLEKRMVMISANNFIDGAMTCLSGCTVGYRSEILKVHAFIYAFINDLLLDSGDDVFITYWLLCHGWKVRLQKAASATISTSTEGSSKHLLQRLRWSRNTKRGQIRCLLMRPWMWM